MQAIDFWKLSDEYSVMHAALITAGYAPTAVEHLNDDLIDRKYPGYIAVRTALRGAIETGAIKATKLFRHEGDFESEGIVNVERTLLSAAALDGFFRSRNFECEFFSRATSQRGSAEPTSAFFSKKLDAANRAWQAVTSDPSLMAGKSPKQALEKWLTDNAADLGLLNKNGQPNRTGIDEICKVANWRPEGGATPTPVARPAAPIAPLTKLPSISPSRAPPRESFSADLDDEIPF